MKRRIQLAIERLESRMTLPDEERTAIYKELAALAERDTSSFEEVLLDFDRTIVGERLRYMVLIEAVALESSSLFDFLAGELDRLRREAEDLTLEAAAEALSAFEFLEQSESYRARALALHVSGLRSDVASVRLAAVHSLHGWRVAEEIGLADQLRTRLQDASWRVRRAAEWLLADEGLLPPGYRTPLLDRTIRWLIRSAASQLLFGCGYLLDAALAGGGR